MADPSGELTDGHRWRRRQRARPSLAPEVAKRRRVTGSGTGSMRPSADSGSQVCVSGCHRRSNCAGPVPLKSTPSIGVENPSPPDCQIVPPMSAENVLATVVSVGAPPSGGGGKTADPQLSKALAVTQRLPPPNGCNSRSSSWSCGEPDAVHSLELVDLDATPPAGR